MKLESKFTEEFKDGSPLYVTECVTGFKVFQSLGASWNGTDGLYFDTMTETLDWVKSMSNNVFVLEYVNGCLQVKPVNDTVENLVEAVTRLDLVNEELSRKLRYFKECNENQYLLIRALKKETL
jgi:hypothetical protein